MRDWADKSYLTDNDRGAQMLTAVFGWILLLMLAGLGAFVACDWWFGCEIITAVVTAMRGA